MHEKTYGGGSAVAERVYIIIYGLKPAPKGAGLAFKAHKKKKNYFTTT